MVWAGSSQRLDELAEDVGAVRKNIHIEGLPKFLAPVKYVIYFMMTQVFLFSRRPDVVYCQNPPVFAPLSCIPYCALMRRRLVIDHHNVWSVKSFGTSAVSGALKALERLAARSAFLNTVPHDYWGSVIKTEFSGRALTVHDCVGRNPNARSDALRGRVAASGLIGMAASLSFQESLEAEALGVERVEGVTLAMTGPPKRLGPRLTRMGDLRRVKFLGFLPRDEYEQLKASSDFGLNITDEPYTVNHMLYEYAAASLPTISSRNDEIEAVFGDSLLYVARPDAKEVAEKVAMFAEDPAVLADYRGRIARRFEELTTNGKRERALLKRVLTAP
jgi:hypothetical protein